MFSRVPIDLAFTALHVLLSRWIGAVPRAEMIEVRVEKLFSKRHFYTSLVSSRRRLAAPMYSHLQH